jgi:anti-sigma B factor antagonist
MRLLSPSRKPAAAPAGSAPVRNAVALTSVSEQRSLLTLSGDLDLSTLDELSEALARASGCERLLIDLSDATFIDCSVINALLRAAAGARARQAELEIIGTARAAAVRRALEMTGSHDRLTALETLAEAQADRPPRLGRGALERELRSPSRTPDSHASVRSDPPRAKRG